MAPFQWRWHAAHYREAIGQPCADRAHRRVCRRAECRGSPVATKRHLGERVNYYAGRRRCRAKANARVSVVTSVGIKIGKKKRKYPLHSMNNVASVMSVVRAQSAAPENIKCR